MTPGLSLGDHAQEEGTTGDFLGLLDMGSGLILTNGDGGGKGGVTTAPLWGGAGGVRAQVRLPVVPCIVSPLPDRIIEMRIRGGQQNLHVGSLTSRARAIRVGRAKGKRLKLPPRLARIGDQK